MEGWTSLRTRWNLRPDGDTSQGNILVMSARQIPRSTSPFSRKSHTLDDQPTEKACLAEAKPKERAAKADYMAARGTSCEDEAAERHIATGLAVYKAKAAFKKAEKEAKKAVK